MKAAIYARKSTDDNDRNADNKSVTRQVEHAKAYAAKQGWTVADEHVFIDDGISGAEFKNRPALIRMLNHLKDYDIIVMSELSRLGREQTQVSGALANIMSKSVRVFFYLTDDELKFESAVDKFMVSAMSFGAELEREKASQRARDGLLKKAEKGYNTGGRVYGYDNVTISSTNSAGESVRSHTEYKINEAEAEVVRSIFRMYADGHGVRNIALALNGDPRHRRESLKYFASQTPPSPWKGTGSWAPSSVRAILHRERYTGKVPFGKHRNLYRQGTKARAKQTEYLLVDVPRLRIVPEDLWRAVRDRSTAVAKTYIRDTNGTLWGRPGMGRESKYLLTGLGRCAICGGNLTVLGGKNGSGAKRRPVYYYGCSYRHNRGETVCTNDHRVQMPALDDAVLESVEHSILSPEAITYTVEKALQLLAERRRENPDRPRQIEAELKKLRKELARFVTVIAEGKAPKTLREEIAKREALIEILEKEQAELEVVAVPVEMDTARLRKALIAKMGRFKELVYGDVPVARQALRKLLAEPIQFTPVTRDGRKTYSFKGITRLGVLLEPGYIELASPRGAQELPALRVVRSI